MLKGKVESAKKHVQEHCFAYVAVTGAAVAGITCVIMRSTAAQWGAGKGDAQWGSTNTASFNYRNKGTINVTTVIEREGRGHPGWPVRNLETKHIFLSQKAAAEAFGIPEGILSAHLNGKFPEANGLHFERVNLSA